MLPFLGLPKLPTLAVDTATAQAFEAFTTQWMQADCRSLDAVPGDTLTYLRWLAAYRPVLFHGSHRDNIGELRPDRESRDSTAFGDQRAVFASDDPAWAMWFALLTRGPELASTRNGVWFFRGARKHRRYFFSVNSGVPQDGLLTDGWIYVLPRAGFSREPPAGGLLYSGQWVSPEPTRSIARIAVHPEDFPFADCVGRHDPNESMLRTVWRAHGAATRSVPYEDGSRDSGLP